MITIDTLPRIGDCIALYRRAYERHGTDPFTAEQLDVGPSETEPETDRLLELAVAYGLFAFDGTTYRLRCPPDTADDCWWSAARERTAAIRRAVSDSADGTEAAGGVGEATLSRDGRTFLSVFVTESDDLGTVARAIADRRGGDADGIVLRSPGDRAGDVQRIADRLCDASAVAETPLAGPLQKESTDVVGDDTDALEFRLFLLGDA